MVADVLLQVPFIYRCTIRYLVPPPPRPERSEWSVRDHGPLGTESETGCCPFHLALQWHLLFLASLWREREVIGPLSGCPLQSLRWGWVWWLCLLGRRQREWFSYRIVGSGIPDCCAVPLRKLSRWSPQSGLEVCSRWGVDEKMVLSLAYSMSVSGAGCRTSGRHAIEGHGYDNVDIWIHQVGGVGEVVVVSDGRDLW